MERTRSIKRKGRPSWTSLIVFLVLFADAATTLAAVGITYNGRLLRPDGNPVRASSVHFRIQLRTPNSSNCLMYEEIQVKNLSETNGVFAITLNDGSQTVSNTEPFNLETVFRSHGVYTFPSGKCSGTDTVDFSSILDRQIAVSFNDGSFSGWEPLPAQGINFVPTAIESITVGGHRAKDLFRVHDPAGAPQAMSPWAVADYQKLLNLIENVAIVGGNANIDGTSVGFTGSLSGDVSGGQNSTLVGRLQGREVLNVTPTNGQVLAWNHANSRWEPSTPVTGGAPSGAAGGDLDGTYPSPLIADNAITSAKINTGAVTDDKITGVSASKITSGTGLYLTYAPNGSSCTIGQILEWNNARWECADANAGTVTKVTSGNGDIAITNISSTPELVLNAGTGAGQILKLNSSSQIPAVSGALLVDLNAANVTSGTLDVARLPTTVTDSLWGLSSGSIYRLSGNVGIGTDAPSEKLDVDGRVRAAEFCIAGDCINTWSSAGGSGDIDGIVTDSGSALSGGTVSGTATLSLVTDDATVEVNGGNQLQVKDGGISTAKIGDAQVTGSKLEDSGVAANTYGSSTQIPAITVDAKGRVTNVTEHAIPDILPVAAGQAGKYLRSDGTGWVAEVVHLSDIKDSTGATSAFNVGSCAAHQTVAWSSITDSFTCQNIGSLNASAITAGTLDAARLPLSISDALWTHDSGNVYRSTGKVGIGTISPDAQLTVNRTTTADWQKFYSGYDSTMPPGRIVQVLSVGKATTAKNATEMDYTHVGDDSDSNYTSWGVKGAVHLHATAAGKYGIGLTNPTTALDVNGTVNATAITINGVPVSAGGGDNLGDHTAGQNLNLGTYELVGQGGSSGISIDSAGQVGIGSTSPEAKLDVAGEVKFGNTSSACTSLTEGQQRYNSTAKKMEFCNGTSWISYGSSVMSRNVVSAITGEVISGTSAIPVDNSKPQSHEGTQVVTAAITTTTPNSRVRVSARIQGWVGVAGGRMVAAIFRDSEPNALAAGLGITPATMTISFNLDVVDSPGPAGTYIYKLRVGADSSSGSSYWTLNGVSGNRYFGGASNTGLILDEIVDP